MLLSLLRPGRGQEKPSKRHRNSKHSQTTIGVTTADSLFLIETEIDPREESCRESPRPGH